MLENTVSVKVIVMKTVVSEKGQVTIPRKIRQRLGIFPGTVIEFEAQGGRLIGKKPIADDPVLSVTGIIKGPSDIDEYINETRGKAR
jgi:antitoxin PrlF